MSVPGKLHYFCPLKRIALLLSDEVKTVSQLSAWPFEEHILNLYAELEMGFCIDNRQSSVAVMCLQ